MDMVLKVQVREKQEKLASDFMAGVVYGQNTENILVKIKTNDFIKIYEKAGESNLVSLQIEGQGDFQVLVKDVQKNPVKGFFIHVDFYRVDMSRELSANIPLNFIGESKAVKELGALLVKSLDELSVECLPNDLVDHIDVDISALDDFGDSIFIKDINIPKGMKILDNIDDVVATVVEPKEEKEEAPVTPEAVTPEAGSDKKEGDKKDAKPEASKDDKK